MTDSFDWRVHATASGGAKLNVAKAEFGDGYVQSAPQGLNVSKQQWQVTVSGPRADLEPIRDFIVDHAGIAFYWTPPLGEEGLYQCDDYSPSNLGGLYYTMSMTFYEVFAP